MPIPFNPDIHLRKSQSEVSQIQGIVQRLHKSLERDEIVQGVTDGLRDSLQVDRVVIYYFYAEWEGRVTFESLSNREFSIFGSTGPDECFNGDYAAMYAQGRVSAIADIEIEAIAPCHRDFLRDIGVRANLVVPILLDKFEPDQSLDVPKQLWGLLVAHHCQGDRPWLSTDIERMQAGALKLAESPSIKAASQAAL